MADQITIPELDVATDPTNGSIYIIVGGQDYQISYDDFVQFCLKSGGSQISEEWVSEETGVIVVGDISDNVIEVKGTLVCDTVTAKVVLTITKNGASYEVDYQLTPYRTIFETIFTTAAANGSDIELSFDVGVQSANIIFKATVNNFNI